MKLVICLRIIGDHIEEWSTISYYNFQLVKYFVIHPKQKGIRLKVPQFYNGIMHATKIVILNGFYFLTFT